MTTLVRGKKYRFKFASPAIIQSEMIGTVKGVSMDYTLAQQITDVAHIHAAALPSLPAGTPTDARDLEYVVVSDDSGTSLAFAMQWLREDPELMGSGLAVAQIAPATQSDLVTIRALLEGAGFSVSSLSLSE